MRKSKFLILNTLSLTLLLLTGCKEDPAVYSKDKAAGRAMERLVRYADSQRVPVSQFQGPFFKENIGGEQVTYMVCYKSKTHYFCRDDWSGNEFGGVFSLDSYQARKEINWLREATD